MISRVLDTFETAANNGGIDADSDTSIYDVVIVGGGAAGIGAAIGAKQAYPNSRVLIIESEGFLGGAATHRGVHSYCGLYTVDAEPRRAVGEIWTEIHTRLVAERASRELPDRVVAYVQHIDPEGAKHVLDDLIADYGIDVLLHCTVIGGERQNDNVVSVRVQERRGQRNIQGRAFVDCSGDGDLAHHAGASTRYGNSGHVNMGSLATRFGGLQNAHPSSRLWRDAIQKAKAVDPALKKTIPRNVGVLIELPGSGDIVTYMASAIYDARDSASISAAERKGRQQAKVYLDILRKLPGHENMYLVSSGPNFGTRESRHINCRYQLTEADIFGRRDFEDVVAVGAWYTEYHDGTKEDWPIIFQEPPEGCFDIPLSSLHSIDTPNLYCAGRCADGDQGAASAVRVMGTAFATGQAAGTAAGLCASTGSVPDPQLVRSVLLKHGALLDRHNLTKAPYIEEDGGLNMTRAKALQKH